MFGRVVFLSFAPSEFSAYAAGAVYAYFMRLLGKTPETFTVQDFYRRVGNRMLGAMALGVRYMDAMPIHGLKNLMPNGGFGRGQTPNQPANSNPLTIEKARNPVGARAEPLLSVDETLNNKLKPSRDLLLRREGTRPLFGTPRFIFRGPRRCPPRLYRSKASTLFLAVLRFFDGNLVEEYPETESDYETFMRTSLVPIMRRCLAAKIWVCLYIPTNMYNDLKKVFGSAKKKFKFVAKMNNLNGAYSNSNIIYCWKATTTL